MKFLQAKIRQRNAWFEHNSPLTFLRAISFVSTPPFENGVLPDALLSFLNARERKVFGTVKIDQMEIGYLVRDTQEEQLKQFLHESLPRKAMSLKQAICFGVDKDGECFFFNSKTGKSLLEITLPASLKVFRQIKKPVRSMYNDMLYILNVDLPNQTPTYAQYAD